MKKVFTYYLFKDLIGLILIFFAFFSALSDFGGGGVLGQQLEIVLYNILGSAHYFLTAFLVLLGILLIINLGLRRKIELMVAGFLLLVSFFIYFALAGQAGLAGKRILFSRNYIGRSGLLLLSALFNIVTISLIFSKSLKEIMAGFKRLPLKMPSVTVLGKKSSVTSISNNQPTVNQPASVASHQVSDPGAISVSLFGKDKRKANGADIEIKTRKLPLKSTYSLPPLSLLEKKDEVPESGDIRNNIQIIKRTLSNFGIPVEVEEITIGPTITRYGIRLSEGIKIAKILALQNDLALNLAVATIRIEAPIAGKSLVGIEVPNQKIAKVRLRNLAEEPEFLENESLTYLPVGRMVAGEGFFSDLALMPHLLIAGTTGSGKSMFIHALILSLLLKNTPETMNFILVDPKRVELVRYEEVPHLLMEPVLDSKKVIAVMQWLIREMEERFLLLQEHKMRDLESYNKLMVHKQKEMLPRIVLMIDEMADLMLTHGAALEASIVRLTQMARATGIHLVLATQRPSVDVVTGLIKANVPNRICFKVASQVDSRTVLDFAGAEKLLGSGDALFVSTRFMGTRRLQAPLVSEKEIHNIVDHWHQEAEAAEKVDEEKARRRIDLDELNPMAEATVEGDDELLSEAYRLIVETGKASTSFLQRKLRIGYGRSARLLDLLEEKGIVGPAEGTRPRRVLAVNEPGLDKSNQNNEVES